MQNKIVLFDSIERVSKSTLNWTNRKKYVIS